MLVREALRGPLRRAVRGAGGGLWLAAWALLLYEVDRPWRDLGGVLSERMRWLERFVLGTAFVAGCLAGTLARDATEDAPDSRPMRVFRRAWLGPACFVAVLLVWLESRGDWPWILLVLAGWLGYWSGLDVACGAWPLLRTERALDEVREE